MKEIGYTKFQERELTDIGIWVQVLKESNKGAGYAKKIVDLLIAEVKRIIRANPSMSGFYDVGLYDWRFVPEPERDKPVLHWIVTVESYQQI